MTMPGPVLALTHEIPGEIELHWSAAASGWRLEESGNLDTASWAAAPFPLGGVIGEGVISVRMRMAAGSRKFFRLRQME
jgi:hypothetical protein